jgi:hypothetical protein
MFSQRDANFQQTLRTETGAIESRDSVVRFNGHGEVEAKINYIDHKSEMPKFRLLSLEEKHFKDTKLNHDDEG